jgi:hypothetical protein
MERETLTPLMQRVKAQAEVLVPLLHHLRSELGKDTANELVYGALRDSVRKWTSDMASSDSDDPIENWRKTSDTLEAQFDGDVDYEVLRHDAKAFDFNVTGCRYADFFRQLDEPELGAILTCEVDDHIAELSASAVSLSRQNTLMKGGANCPFRYQFIDRDD